MGKKPTLSFATAWINNFDKVKSTPRLDNLEYCDDVANGFGEMMYQGGHIWVIKQEQDDPKAADWIDRNLQSIPKGSMCSGNGDDAKLRRGMDTVEFALISSHGGFPGSGENYGPSCSIFFNDQRSPRVCSCQMRLGNTRLKWLVLDTCHSLRTSSDPTGVNPDRIWRHAFDGLHSIFGFTGQCADGPLVNDRGECFAALIVLLDSELAEAWMDSASSFLVEDNPGVAVAGRSKKDAIERLESETISSWFSSIPNKEVKYIAWRFRVSVSGNPSPTEKG